MFSNYLFVYLSHPPVHDVSENRGLFFVASGAEHGVLYKVSQS